MSFFNLFQRCYQTQGDEDLSTQTGGADLSRGGGNLSRCGGSLDRGGGSLSRGGGAAAPLSRAFNRDNPDDLEIMKRAGLVGERGPPLSTGDYPPPLANLESVLKIQDRRGNMTTSHILDFLSSTARELPPDHIDETGKTLRQKNPFKYWMERTFYREHVPHVMMEILNELNSFDSFLSRTQYSGKINKEEFVARLKKIDTTVRTKTSLGLHGHIPQERKLAIRHHLGIPENDLQIPPDNPLVAKRAWASGTVGKLPITRFQLYKIVDTYKVALGHSELQKYRNGELIREDRGLNQFIDNIQDIFEMDPDFQNSFYEPRRHNPQQDNNSVRFGETSALHAHLRMFNMFQLLEPTYFERMTGGGYRVGGP